MCEGRNPEYRVGSASQLIQPFRQWTFSRQLWEREISIFQLLTGTARAQSVEDKYENGKVFLAMCDRE